MSLGIHIGLMAKAFILILHSEFGGEVNIAHDNVQSCPLIIFQYQPISLQYSSLSVEQPIRLQLSVIYASLGISNTIKDSNVNMPLWYLGYIMHNRLRRLRNVTCKYSFEI